MSLFQAGERIEYQSLYTRSIYFRGHVVSSGKHYAFVRDDRGPKPRPVAISRLRRIKKPDTKMVFA